MLMAFLVFDFLVVAVLVGLFLLRGERQLETELRELGVTIYPEAHTLSDFRLLDGQGQFFTTSDFQGHWNLVFFGFTNCPDICPLTMAELDQFYSALDFDQDVKPRVFLVTVDPGKDDPEAMKAYLASYNTDFIGLSGDPGQIKQLADELYVGYGDAVQPEADAASHEHGGSHSEIVVNEGDYLIEHSAHIAVINPEGDYYAVMRAPHRDQDLVRAFRALVQ